MNSPTFSMTRGQFFFPKVVNALTSVEGNLWFLLTDVK